jgi:hypothetical protein
MASPPRVPILTPQNADVSPLWDGPATSQRLFGLRWHLHRGIPCLPLDFGRAVPARADVLDSALAIIGAVASIRFAVEALSRNLGEPVNNRPFTRLLGSTSCGNRPVRRAIRPHDSGALRRDVSPKPEGRRRTAAIPSSLAERALHVLPCRHRGDLQQLRRSESRADPSESHAGPIPA